MNLPGLDNFSEVWVTDFEFHAPSGERQQPICMVAKELRSGGSFRLWLNKLHAQKEPPIPNRPDVLVVAYYASAELGCYLALNWPMPLRILDLFTEFRCITNGLPVPCGNGLLGALAYHELSCIDAAEKDSMRDLAIRGGPFTGAERRALLNYCWEDVNSLERLLPAMLPKIDIPRALLRGRYMAAAAKMEWTGTPLDMPTLTNLRNQWDEIQDQLIVEIDRDFGVYEGRTFKTNRWADYLKRNDLAWPHHQTGTLDLSDDAFRKMSKLHPQISPIRELRYSLSQLRLSDLAVGSDGRNRCLLSTFRAKTGRNQPSSSRFIFGPSVWIRGLIKPNPGRAIAYVDYEQQEFGIAAALSGDEAMKRAYLSGDPYLAFAKQACAAPENATKTTHGQVREQFKVCALAVQYGMGEQSLAVTLDQPQARARELLQLHHQTYPRYWRWNDAAVNHAMILDWLQTVFGWQLHIGPGVNPRSLQNFPMQANGAEILRLACCLLTEVGIEVCAPVHDAVLVEASDDDIDDAVAKTQRLMADASEVVLSGFRLRTDAEIVRYPERYMDSRGFRMWEIVTAAMGKLATAKETVTDDPLTNNAKGHARAGKGSRTGTCPVLCLMSYVS